MEEKTNERKPIPTIAPILEIAKAFPSFIAIFSFLVLTLSIVHEYAFFEFVGRAWRTVQTPGDYLRDAIDWIPETFGLIGLYLILYRAIANAFFSIERISRPIKKRLTKITRIRFRLIILFVISPLLLLFLLGISSKPERQIAYFFCFSYAWGVILIFYLIFSKSTILAELNVAYLFSIFVIPIVLALAWFSGSLSALKSFDNPVFDYQIRFKNGELHKSLILRNMERGVLFLENDKIVRLAFWNEITSIEKVNKETDVNPLLCRVFPDSFLKLCR